MVCFGQKVRYYSLGDGPFIYVSSTGDLHKLYRKATAGHPEALAFLPVFHSTIERVRSSCSNMLNHPIELCFQVADKWQAAIAADPSGKSVIVDMNSWMSKVTLDV